MFIFFCLPPIDEVNLDENVGVQLDPIIIFYIGGLHMI